MSFSILQYFYLFLLLIIGFGILYVRRKADGNKSLYKLLLIFSGLLLSLLTFGGDKIFDFEKSFLGNVSVILLVILIFELSTRLNPENIKITTKSLKLFFLIILLNIIIFSILSIYLFDLSVLHAILLSLILSGIEYFMVDELRSEGDLANPILLLSTFIIFAFYSYSSNIFYDTLNLFKYLIIGLGSGILLGIIIFKTLKHRKITWIHEVSLIAASVIAFVVTEYVGGSGIFSVMIMGIFFGNSHVRRKVQLLSFSSTIYKSLEILIFLIIGFVVSTNIGLELFIKGLILFIIYLLLRFLIILIIYPKYSLSNKLILTIAPKGMMMGVMIILLSIFFVGSTVLSDIMLIILVLSLLLSSIFEHVESKKINRLDRLYIILKNLRFGRKKDLLKNNKHK